MRVGSNSGRWPIPFFLVERYECIDGCLGHVGEQVASAVPVVDVVDRRANPFDELGPNLSLFQRAVGGDLAMEYSGDGVVHVFTP